MVHRISLESVWVIEIEENLKQDFTAERQDKIEENPKQGFTAEGQDKKEKI